VAFDLLRVFGFYLAMTFLVGVLLRVRQYEAVVRLVRAVPGRWPRLFDLVKRHHGVFLTWSTLLPALLALGLTLLHTLAYRVIYPAAGLSVGRLVELPAAVPVVTLAGGLMLGFDLYVTFTAGEIDRGMLEKYFDQAEYWLRSWVAPVVHVFTLGRVSPRRMVADEVAKALVEASQLLNSTLWWVVAQVGLRIAFGVALWLTVALS
jgi:hypothetical protein